MAGRFLLQKISSGASRSRSLLGAHASASATTAAPVTPCSLEAGFKTLNSVFHGAAVYSGTVLPNNHGFHVCAARYLNKLACTSAAAKTGWSTTGMPSTISNHKKSAFVNSVGSKQACSSGASKKHENSWEAILVAWQLRVAALVSKTLVGGVDDSRRYVTVMFSMAILLADCMVPIPGKHPTSRYNSLNRSGGCMACCQCQCHGSTAVVPRS